ncbi:acireductone synthase [Paracraurococcus lichenis]|uniref:Enolase-phosphatase E1 n=1 Tax=Paracraurococcus lichenis TaxID=3064888 RepID=A0ABT9E648_9PROT|nr:acireductone synthase [Paracraurococcus sp. LOR1-02]MDO9711647.1 acireductone synthase [Paracraurococcus sp. LOR1-02]
MAPPRAVLTDIEGTTTSIAFVKDRLFPFAQAALEGFLAAHGAAPAVASILDDVRAAAPGQDPVAALRGWMAADAKVTPLKALQGLIWRQGYADGRLKGHLWPDVAACLRAWRAGGVTLAVYSSGSVEAQRDLFGHSEAGDLTPLFAGFFDTRVGAKREAPSYAAIAAALGLPPEEILFLSDVAEELDAARAVGLQACQLVRAADGTVPSGRHPEEADFPGVARRFGLSAA